MTPPIVSPDSITATPPRPRGWHLLLAALFVILAIAAFVVSTPASLWITSVGAVLLVSASFLISRHLYARKARSLFKEVPLGLFELADQITPFEEPADYQDAWESLVAGADEILLISLPPTEYLDRLSEIVERGATVKVYRSFANNPGVSQAILDLIEARSDGHLEAHHLDSTPWGFVTIARSSNDAESGLLVTFDLGANRSKALRFRGKLGEEISASVIARLSASDPGPIAIDSQQKIDYIRRKKNEFNDDFKGLVRGVPLRGARQIYGEMSKTLAQCTTSARMTHLADAENLELLTRPFVEDWLARNYEAVERGIDIHRIFLVPATERTNPILEETMSELHDRGVRISLQPADDLSDFYRKDFSLFDDRTLLYNYKMNRRTDSIGDGFSARMTVRASEVDQYLAIFKELSQTAEAYQPPGPGVSVWFTRALKARPDHTFTRQGPVWLHHPGRSLNTAYWEDQQLNQDIHNPARHVRFYHLRNRRLVDESQPMVDQGVEANDVFVLLPYDTEMIDDIVDVIRVDELPSTISDLNFPNRTSLILEEIEQGGSGPGLEICKILFVAANPSDREQLDTSLEYREIRSVLRGSRLRDRYPMDASLATRFQDLQAELLERSRCILHFSGHGSRYSELMLEDENGSSQPVPINLLEDLFQPFAENLEGVVLNACSTQPQAKAIARFVPWVVGTPAPIGDDAAIAFSEGFYRALGAGEPIETCFEVGRTRLISVAGESSTQPLLLSGKTSRP